MKRIGNVCKEVMDGINPDLRFTVESEEDFPDRRLQTLDFETWATSVIHSLRKAYNLL